MFYVELIMSVGLFLEPSNIIILSICGGVLWLIKSAMNVSLAALASRNARCRLSAKVLTNMLSIRENARIAVLVQKCARCRQLVKLNPRTSHQAVSLFGRQPDFSYADFSKPVDSRSSQLLQALSMGITFTLISQQ
jgi:hypothetical protein